MIEVKKLELPEVIPQGEVDEYKNKILVVGCGPVPEKVAEFIEALAMELGDLEQESKYQVMITGVELLLANVEEIGGQAVIPNAIYPMDVPVMRVVNRKAELYRIYHKQGPQGLRQYCRVKCNPRAARQLIEILNMHVFKK
jgi:PHP family Zn ribbon phosphoesterase